MAEIKQEKLRQALEDSTCLLGSLAGIEANSGGQIDAQISENCKALTKKIPEHHAGRCRYPPQRGLALAT